MNKEKLTSIKLEGSIDTLSIVSPQISARLPKDTRWLNDTSVYSNQGDLTHYKYIINPNKTGVGEVYNYHTHKLVMEHILKKMEITQYYENRVDFRVDSYQDNYDELLKLNKCVILMLAIKYKVSNRYQSFDPLTLDNLTIRIQNKRLEAENYNKKLQESTGDVQNRLELRSKSIPRGKGVPELVSQWTRRLDILHEHFLDLQDRCNIELVKSWNKEQGSTVKSLSEFMRKYQENIFTRKQLIALYEAVGASEPARAADNFKQRNKIEFFSHNDIKMYLCMVSKSLKDYLYSCSF